MPNFKQFLFSHNPMLTFIEGAFRIGAAGAVRDVSLIGSGFNPSSTLAAITPSGGTGIYRLTLAEKFQRLVGFSAFAVPPTSTSQTIDGTAIIVGKAYQIIVASTGSNWGTLGVPTGVTPSTGLCFVAASGASQMPASSVALVGNGTVARVMTPNVQNITILPGYNLALNPTTALLAGNRTIPNSTDAGSIFFLQTYDASSGSPVMPTSGTLIRFNLFLRKSSVLGANETSSNY